MAKELCRGRESGSWLLGRPVNFSLSVFEGGDGVQGSAGRTWNEDRLFTLGYFSTRRLQS